MNVLLVGGGGREHAIAEAISRSKKKPKLYSIMADENPGIADVAISEDFLLMTRPESKDADAIAIEAYNREICRYAIKNGVKMAIIGPEAPLADGLADMLWEAGIPVVGPRKLAAQIEFDKAWARDLLKNYDIAGLPEYCSFTRRDEAGGEKDIDALETAVDAYIDQLKDVAVKPKGLTGGKGVFVTGSDGDIRDAKRYAKEVLKKDDLVIEEKLIGEEFTVQAFVDGKALAFAPAVQDHKRALEGDKGKNTGGMGSHNDSKDFLPFMIENDYEDAKAIMADVVGAIKTETGAPYQGILYGQFMKTVKGMKVIEFNARFGDPEAMNVLPLLENDFLDVCTDIVSGTLKPEDIKFKKLATVCKYAVPTGYPENPLKDSLIEIGDVGDAHLFYGSVAKECGKIYTMKSRSIAVVGMGGTIEEAEEKAEAGISAIKGRVYHRSDIGTPALLNKRIVHMQHLLNYGTET